MAVAGGRELSRRIGARLEPLVEVQLELAVKGGTRELVGEHRRESDRDGRRHVGVVERAERLEERQVGVDRRLADPVAAVWPTTVIQHVREMAVEREDEIDAGFAHARSGAAASTRR